MKTIFSASLLAFLLLQAAPQQDYSQLKSEAESLYTQGSYSRANEVYSKVDKGRLTKTEARWVEFRLADTSWRAQAATETSDNTKYEAAQQQLNELIRDGDKESDRDLVWAEAHESLGDFMWTRQNAMNWGSAWPHYQQSLEWWAGQRVSELARNRYLRIVFKAAEPPRPDQYYFYTYYGNYIPLNILENALKISTNDNDKTHLHYLMAMTMRVTGDLATRQRVADEFEDALPGGKRNDWYDDALFHYAEWMNSNGEIRFINNQWQQIPNYVKALELYRRLTTEFTKGETRVFDQAQQRIKEITEPTLNVGVANIFVPGSEQQFYLNTRNVKRVTVGIYKIDLTRDVSFIKSSAADEGEAEGNGWLQRMALDARQPVKTWTKELPDSNEHKPYREEIRIDSKLPVGAYLLEAKVGSLSSRDLLLVTDVSIVVKSSSKQLLAYFANAVTGAPVANANVTLWENYYTNDSKWHWRRIRGVTNGDGLALFTPLTKSISSRNYFVSAASGDRQAFSTANSYYAGEENDAWRIYAFTDRPAYRPKETVQWKFIARRLNSGSYSTPANQTVEYQINDPRGNKVSEGKAVLNAFGSAWGSVELGEQLPLGEYNILFWESGRTKHIGGAQLFRLEEYKLPEFKVVVKTPEENGRKKAFRVGENVEVNIQADYYFGGPVANASVEVVVYQNPFYHYWFPRREYSWYYDDMQQFRRYYGRGQVIKRETIRTDATGKATLTFETPRENYNQDYDFQIEARVTDSSRREINATDNVRVTRYRYYVYPRPQRNIYQPKDKVTVDIKALDANQQPIKTDGSVKITRDYWWEVWLAPNGREVKGEELRLLREKGQFPPQTAPGQTGWRLQFRGYQHEDIATQQVTTDNDGEAQVSFVAQREGYYRVAWQSSQGADPKRDRFLPPITAETTVFVATNATTQLGYHTDGVQIVVDKDTFRAGQTAPVMLSVPASDRYVLFTVEADDLYSYKLIHVTGTSKLIELPIEERYIPNVYLSAAMVGDAKLSMDTKPVVVPPVRQFLAVNVRSDREQYQPREEGTLTITARDVDNKPVSAEIALGLIDESVKYIQSDYAGDPRQFYYGNKRGQAVQTQSTFNQKTYSIVTEQARTAAGNKELDRADQVQDSVSQEAEGGSKLENLAAIRPGVAAPTSIGGSAGGFARRDAISKSVEERSSRTPAPPPGIQEPAVQVRSDFRSTILWLPDAKTDADGVATVKVKYPDSLTTWSATARVASAGNQFGIGNSTTRTKQPLIVRLQAPRFFVVGDQVTVSGVINNNTDAPMRVVPKLNAEGLTVTGLVLNGQPVKGEQNPVDVKPNSEARVDWLVNVTHASEAKLRVEARGEKYADAMEKNFPVFEHGIEKFISRSGKMRGDAVNVKLEIPKERRAESTNLTVQVAPSMATTMLDALPYLIDYPYGCTEQTMSRFLPAVITVKTLRDLGLKPETAMDRVFGGIEASSAAATHPKGKHDLRELEEMTKQGLERLYNFQHSDGGWGWWKEGESDHFMTAYVVWGMTLARQAGVEIRSEVLERAVTFLDKELVEEERSFDGQAWMLHALANYHSLQKAKEQTKFQTVAFENLWNNRDKLNAYTRALLALSAHYFGSTERSRVLIQNLENGVKLDSKPDTSVVQSGNQTSDPSVLGTAHWGEDGIYWRWSDGGVEATSFALRALLVIDPKHKLVEPVTNWLVKNRRGAQWSNTRDTAIVVLTLNDYLRVSGEVQPSLSYQLVVNGTAVASKQITPAEALGAPSKFQVSRELLRDGNNEITIRRTSGSGPLYFSAEAKFFSLEEPLRPAGNEIFVRRQYFKLVNHPTLLKGFVSERIPLNDGETVKSGDRVEVVLTVEAKNNYEYLLFEDLKPAGLEAVQIRSGESLFIRELKSGALGTLNNVSTGDFTGRSRWVYQELRDRKVALFVDQLPEGVWQLSYEMRAEAPGVFHALPVLGHAMYVPEIRTNGAEIKVKVVD